MAHFAQVKNGIVLRVIVAEQDFIDSGKVGETSAWIQTSYDTKGGVHLEGGTPLRKNYAGIGYTYDKTLDAFIPPKRYDSWSLDEEKCYWLPPSPAPQDGKSYDWDEETVGWKEVPSLVAAEEITP